MRHVGVKVWTWGLERWGRADSKLTDIEKVRNLKVIALVSKVIAKSFSVMAKFKAERKNVSSKPKSLTKFEELRRWLVTEIMESESVTKVKALVTQSCRTHCDPMDCSLSGSTVHGILQARILGWVAMLFSRG